MKNLTFVLFVVALVAYICAVSADDKDATKTAAAAASATTAAAGKAEGTKNDTNIFKLGTEIMKSVINGTEKMVTTAADASKTLFNMFPFNHK